jgi:hypothetical protein
VISKVAKHTCEDKFFHHIDISARRSAQHLVGFLHCHLPVSSVLDFERGPRVWVEEWRRSGVADPVEVLRRGGAGPRYLFENTSMSKSRVLRDAIRRFYR